LQERQNTDLIKKHILESNVADSKEDDDILQQFNHFYTDLVTKTFFDSSSSQKIVFVDVVIEDQIDQREYVAQRDTRGEQESEPHRFHYISVSFSLQIVRVFH
jgi:hypothetical protein